MSDKSSRLTGSRALFVVLTVLLLAPIATGSLTRAIASSDDKDDSFYREFSVFTEVLEHIRKRYVEEASLEALFEGAFDGAADALDPMATYVPAESVSTYLDALGLGVRRSGLQLVRDRGFLFVVGVVPGSPGDAAGVQSGDIVSQLNGDSTRLLPLWKARVTLGGEPGSEVTLEVLRQGQTMEFDFALQEFEAKKPSVEVRDGVSIVRIGQFEPGLVAQLEDLLATPAVSSSDRLILDVRSVAGGNLEVALEAADLFADGSLGELRERSDLVEAFASARPRIWTGRLLILTNRGTQGASEAFTAVLKQLSEATTVGRGTFGHAGRTASKTLSGGGEFFYTDAFYIAPDGTKLNEALAPDTRVTGSSRRPGDADRSLDELIMDRAIELALEPETALKEAA